MRTRALTTVSILLVTGAARGDGAWVREVRDGRGRLVGVVPRQSASISMREESVALVPFLRGSEALLYVNVRYRFVNAGAPVELLVGFPEMRGYVVESEGMYDARPTRTTEHATIEAFAADVGARTLAVSTAPGTREYARWFTFTTPFAAGETVLRNRYIAHPGSVTTASHSGNDLEYSAEYVLHTGAQWAGPIGHGEVTLWNGERAQVRRFEALTPTARDDVHVPLVITARPSAGRPLFVWNYGNGNQNEDVTPRLDPASLVQESSAATSDDLAQLGAMALDEDPSTAWQDAGAHGAVGEWMQVPTHLMGRLRAMTLSQGPASATVARVRTLRLTCFDLEGNALSPTAFDELRVSLDDRDGAQRVVFERPLGACHAVRLTVEAMHGAAGSHARIAELSFED